MPSTTVRVTPMAGIWILAIGSPSAGQRERRRCGAAAGDGDRGRGRPGAVVVVVGRGRGGGGVRRSCELLVELVATSASWDWASCRPVPQSWYATNSRISAPAVISVRPTPPRIFEQHGG